MAIQKLKMSDVLGTNGPTYKDTGINTSGFGLQKQAAQMSYEPGSTGYGIVAEQIIQDIGEVIKVKQNVRDLETEAEVEEMLKQVSAKGELEYKDKFDPDVYKPDYDNVRMALDTSKGSLALKKKLARRIDSHNLTTNNKVLVKKAEHDKKREIELVTLNMYNNIEDAKKAGDASEEEQAAILGRLVENNIKYMEVTYGILSPEEQVKVLSAAAMGVSEEDLAKEKLEIINDTNMTLQEKTDAIEALYQKAQDSSNVVIAMHGTKEIRDKFGDDYIDQWLKAGAYATQEALEKDKAKTMQAMSKAYEEEAEEKMADSISTAGTNYGDFLTSNGGDRSKAVEDTLKNYDYSYGFAVSEKDKKTIGEAIIKSINQGAKDTLLYHQIQSVPVLEEDEKPSDYTNRLIEFYTQDAKKYVIGATADAVLLLENTQFYQELPPEKQEAVKAKMYQDTIADSYKDIKEKEARFRERYARQKDNEEAEQRRKDEKAARAAEKKERKIAEAVKNNDPVAYIKLTKGKDVTLSEAGKKDWIWNYNGTFYDALSANVIRRTISKQESKDLNTIFEDELANTSDYHKALAKVVIKLSETYGSDMETAFVYGALGTMTIDGGSIKPSDLDYYDILSTAKQKENVGIIPSNTKDIEDADAYFYGRVIYHKTEGAMEKLVSLGIKTNVDSNLVLKKYYEPITKRVKEKTLSYGENSYSVEDLAKAAFYSGLKIQDIGKTNLYRTIFDKMEKDEAFAQRVEETLDKLTKYNRLSQKQGSFLEDRIKGGY